jgi:PAS domain S-box-containing protein
MSLVETTLANMRVLRSPTIERSTESRGRSRKALNHLVHLILSLLAVAGTALAITQPEGWRNGLLAIGVAGILYLGNLILFRYVQSIRWGTLTLVGSAGIAIWLNILSYQGEYPLSSLLWITILVWFAIVLAGYKSGLLTAGVMIIMFFMYHYQATPLFYQFNGSATQYIVVPASTFLLSFGIFLCCSTLLLALVDYNRSRYEAQLVASEQRRRLYIEQTNMAIIDCDIAGNITGWNAGAERMFGYQEAEMLGKSTIEGLTASEAQATVRAILADLHGSTAGEIRNTNKNIRKDGRAIVCAWSHTSIRTAEGHFLGFICSAVDITDQIEKERELQLAKETAEAAAHAKGTFLANVSHEIRTPMNGIIGMTNLLRSEKLATQQSEYVENIHKSATALLSIINEILDFSKIESGKVTLEEQQFNLQQCIYDAMSLFEYRETCNAVALTVAIHPRVPSTVKGDAGRLRQILVNLIGNAVKFTREGEIRVMVDATSIGPNQIELTCSVQDTGIGIPPEKLDQLFESFAQVDVSTTREYGGTGLGLSISKLLVEKMGGKIWVESRLNYGSTFHFTLLLQRVRSYHTPQRQNHRNVMKCAKALISMAKQPADLAILLVEDNLINQKVAVRTFEYLGYAVDIANNGVEAVTAITQRRYDVIFMDIQMPQMDGLAATRQIRQLTHARPQLQIIAMTAAVLEDEKRLALDAGMNALLSKPIHPEELAQTLIEIQQQRENHSALAAVPA